MKKVRFSGICVVVLAVLLGLGTSLVNEGPPLISATVFRAPATILTGYFPQGRRQAEGQGGQILQPGGSAPTSGLPANTQASENWAGYIVTPASSDSYTSVSGSWTVPNIPASEDNAVAAQWIGLGGVSTNALLQMGTIEQTENGQAVAEVFWEKLPDISQNVLTVPVGSTISANISESSSSDSTWNLTFTAIAPGGQPQTQTIAVPVDASYAQGMGTSAEWISEDPSDADGQLYPLADMGTVSYSSALVNGQALNSSGSVQPVAMVSSNDSVLVAPSALGADGESFSTSVLNTNVSPSVNPNGNTGWVPRPRSGLHGSPGPRRIQVDWSSGEDGSYSWGWWVSF